MYTIILTPEECSAVTESYDHRHHHLHSNAVVCFNARLKSLCASSCKGGHFSDLERRESGGASSLLWSSFLHNSTSTSSRVVGRGGRPLCLYPASSPNHGDDNSHYAPLLLFAPHKMILFLILLLCCLCVFTQLVPQLPLPQGATATTAATGTPIDFLNIGSGTASYALILHAVLGGINASFDYRNTFANGVKGRPLRLLVRDHGGDDNNTYSTISSVLAESPNLAGLVAILGDDSIRSAYQFVDDQPEGSKLTLIQPLTVSREFTQFSENSMTLIPSRDTETYAEMSYVANVLHARRIAIIMEPSGLQREEVVPEIRRHAVSVGISIVYEFTFEDDTSAYNETALAELIATRPDVVFIQGDLVAHTVLVVAKLLVGLPHAILISGASNIALFGAAIAYLPAGVRFSKRLVTTAISARPSDTSYEMHARFRSELAVLPAPYLNLTSIDSDPNIGGYFYFGWIIGELLSRMVARLDIIDGPSLRRNIFGESSIYAIDDFVLGPYSGPCTGQRTLFCSCNMGARTVRLVSYDTATTEIVLPGLEVVLPLSTCTGSNLDLASPLVAATITPANSPDASRVTSAYLIGRNAAANTGDITVDGGLVELAYDSSSTDALRTLNTERLLTVSAGSLLNVPIGSSTGTGVIVDPVEVRPRLYSGFRRDVVHVSPTYEQELHALASLAVDRGMGISVLSALDDGEAVGTTLTMSMHTLGKEGGGSRSVSTIADGLSSSGESSVTILHGIATAEDIAAIATYLGRTTSGIVAVPMAHLLVWYDELLAAVTDNTHRSRILFATSLPNWAGPVSGATTGTALQTYFDRVPVTNRTPGSLRGFMTHQFLIYISSRIPGVKSSTEFLKMVYGASVISTDTGLVMGPFYDSMCASTTDTACEMNIGARLIRVRSLSAGVTASADSSVITLDSGRIAYTSLPTEDNTLRNIIIIVAVVGSLLLVGGIVIVVLVCFCSGRSNWNAPKDESEAFTIVFTDIQSSTALWAEAPEAMAPALDHHHALIRKLCSKYNGYEVKTIGDAFMIAFKNATDAINLSSALQFDFFTEKSWSPQIDHAYLGFDHLYTVNQKPEDKALYSMALSPDDYGKIWNGLRVRVGIHTGYGEIKKDPVSHGYDYYGTVVNIAARTEARCHGGQVVMTEAALAASGISDDRVTALGLVVLRGIPEPVQMYQLTTVSNRVFPPLNLDVQIHEDNKRSNSFVVGGESSSSIHSNTAVSSSPVVLQHKIEMTSFFTNTMSVMSESTRVAWLKELCRMWRIDLQSVTTDMGSKSSSHNHPHPGVPAQLDSEGLLDLLTNKLAPIAVKRVDTGRLRQTSLITTSRFGGGGMMGGSTIEEATIMDSGVFDNKHLQHSSGDGGPLQEDFTPGGGPMGGREDLTSPHVVLVPPNTTTGNTSTSSSTTAM